MAHFYKLINFRNIYFREAIFLFHFALINFRENYMEKALSLKWDILWTFLLKWAMRNNFVPIYFHEYQKNLKNFDLTNNFTFLFKNREIAKNY